MAGLGKVVKGVDQKKIVVPKERCIVPIRR